MTKIFDNTKFATRKTEARVPSSACQVPQVPETDSGSKNLVRNREGKFSPYEPGELAQLRVKWAKTDNTNPFRGIRKFCTDCMGGSKRFIAECESSGCTLWLFRFGRSPVPRDLSLEQRQKLADQARDRFHSDGNSGIQQNNGASDEFTG